jgi:glycine/D-amino acid oxidase-like deaminating enzyme
MMESIWQNPPLPQFPQLEGDLKTDVLVIGGGMAGLLCAYLLHQAGVQTVLVDEGRICSGVTGRTTAKITAQHGLIYHKLLQKEGSEKARMYLNANLEALALYASLCKQIPCDFETKSSYVYNLRDSHVIDLELEALHRLGFHADKKEELPLPFPTVGAVKFRRQAQFQPLQFASHIARQPEIYENTFVQRLEGKMAITKHGKIQAQCVIVATHFPFMNRHGSYFLKLYQQRSYVLGLKNGPNLGGMYVCGENGGFSFRNSGNYLLLGGNNHRTGKESTGWQPLEDLAEKCYPDAVATHRWATQDCMSLDGIPYIGQYSRHTPGIYVATGFNKWGMTGSMVSAMVLRDLILGRNNPYAPVFNPSRGILKPQFGANALETTVNLLRPTRPRCPHLGCALHWNPQERSWDCSCHGSRFDHKGKRLNNPAQKDLEL